MHRKKTAHKIARSKKLSPGAWFISVRGSYLPASAAGWLTYIPFVGYLFGSLYVAVHHTHDAALIVLYVVPNWVAAGAVMSYLAARKS
jgi:hypothetical protein